MFEALLARASTRFVFVAGKGGVGKTTTAGALALAFADRNQVTHLISTDPAHSVADLFHSEHCSEHLTIEEFDARKYADAFFAELRAPFIELMERGTYLDEADAAGFLDLSIPGIDEVMSAFRLVELHGSNASRIIVDTAPTGHTVRLLDTSAIIESWVSAGRAMAEKAGAVSYALVGQAAPLRAIPLLEEWREAARRFESDVIRDSRAIVVTRAGEVVNAETRRLVADLEQRGMHVGATVAVGSGDADFTVEWYENAHGCDGLRAWERHVTEGGGEGEGEETPAPVPTTLAPSLARALAPAHIFVAGKGGVGKSTIAAAIASTLAQQKRVCIVSTDPAGSLAEVFGSEITAEAQEIEPGLFARQIDAPSEFARMRKQYRAGVNDVFESLGLQEAAALDRRVIEALWDFAPPGIDEIISLVEILDDTDSYDALIVDSAPTGHFLRLVQLPDIAMDWVRALMRFLVKYGTVGSLDALARDLLAFAKRLKRLKLDLSASDTTAVFIVTLNQPMVLAETARLSAALTAAGIPIAATILNRAEDNGGAAALEETAQIRAPEMHHEVVGPAALRSFLRQWKTHGE